MVLIAGFQLLLQRYSRQRDLIVAAHVANRNEAAFADVVGYLADTTVLHMIADFQRLLSAVAADPNQLVADGCISTLGQLPNGAQGAPG